MAEFNMTTFWTLLACVADGAIVGAAIGGLLGYRQGRRLRKLDLEFELRVRAEVKRLIDEFWRLDYDQHLADADATIKARKGVMSRSTFRKILGCLHPDRGASEKMLGEAFHTFNKLELVLCNEEEMPTTPKAGGLPTYEEMLRRKQKASEARRTKRAQRKVAVSRS
jgi:hypothetical protein